MHIEDDEKEDIKAHTKKFKLHDGKSFHTENNFLIVSCQLGDAKRIVEKKAIKIFPKDSFVL